MSNNDKLIANGAEAVALLAMIPLHLMFLVWTYWRLWSWFAPAVGLPTFGIGTIGVATALWSVWSHVTKVTESAEKKRSPWEVLAESTGVRLYALAIGYVFHVWGAP